MRISLVLNCLLAFLPFKQLVQGEDSFDGKIAFESSGLPAEAPKTQGPAIFYDTKADASQWGDLKLRFVYDGIPPKPAKIVLDVGRGVIDSEWLLVNDKDFGLANVVVWLRREPGASPLPVHPDYAKTAGDDVKLATTGEAFVPHVAIARTTQKVVVSNPDPHGYSVKAELFSNSSFNHLLKAGNALELKFPHPEPTPTRLEDSIHSWMSSYLLIRDDPYAGISNKSGSLKIEKLPVGQWTFVVWHESGYIKEATLAGKKVEWPRGRVSLDIKTGENDLSDIKVPAARFNR